MPARRPASTPSPSPASSFRATPPPDPATVRNLRVLATAMVVFVVTLWLALQGSFFPSAAGATQLSIAGLVGVLRVTLEALTLVVPWWLGAAGLGWLLLRALRLNVSSDSSTDTCAAAARTIARLGAGMAVMMLLAYVLALLGLLNVITSWGLCVIGTAVLAWRGVLWHRAHPDGAIALPEIPWTALLWLPGLALLLVAAAIPPGLLWSVEAFSYDALSYHLQLPREWLSMGAMRGLNHNVYSYLPSLVEVSFMQLGAMKGSMYGAIYAAQLWHATTALLAAAAVATIVTRWHQSSLGLLAGALLLALPWVTITGACAYNEMAALGLAGAALVIALQPATLRWSHAVLIGVILGAATLAKLPSGPMLAVPIGLILLLRPWWNRANISSTASSTAQPTETWTRALQLASIAALVGALTLTPYLMRNYAGTGNPVFPFATKTFGLGHWTPELAQRFAAGHAPVGTMSERLESLWKQWLGNRGFGAVGGSLRSRQPGEIESRNVARFAQEDGVSLFWLLTLGGAVAMLVFHSTRRLALALLLMLVIQLMFWLLTTHLQSRFLIATILPGCVLAMVGLGAILQRASSRNQHAILALAVALCVSVYGVNLQNLWSQTVRVQNEQTQAMEPVAPAVLVDSLPAESKLELLALGQSFAGDHVINHEVPRNGKVLLVADVSRLLYIRRPMVYNHAFDVNPLGEIYRQHHSDARAITLELKNQGITHVWVHWSELRRLHATYGFDADLTEATILQLARDGGWTTTFSMENAAAMYVLPAR